MGGLRPWFFLLVILCSLCPSQLVIPTDSNSTELSSPTTSNIATKNETTSQSTEATAPTTPEETTTPTTIKTTTPETITTATTKKSAEPSSTPTTPKATTQEETTTQETTTQETTTQEKPITTTRQTKMTEKPNSTTTEIAEGLPVGFIALIVVGVLVLMGLVIVVCLILRRKKKFPFAPKKKPEKTEINMTEEDVPLESASVETVPAYNDPGLPPLLKDVPRPAGAQKTRDQFKFDTMKQRSQETINQDTKGIVEMSEQSPALVQSTNTETSAPEEFRIVSSVDVFNISEHDSGRRRLFPPDQPILIPVSPPSRTPKL